jgi:hypothetical protein
MKTRKQVWFGFIGALFYQKIEPINYSKNSFHSIFPVNQTILGKLKTGIVVVLSVFSILINNRVYKITYSGFELIL